MTHGPPITDATVQRRTRLAPSPTGALHLGNARTFLATWLLARQNGWKVLLCIEDLDGPRVKQGAAHQAIDDLVWLGLDWDEGPIFQSPRMETYRAAIDQLIVNHWAYPCVCSRREAVLAASAPHADEHQTIYPGTCRDRYQYVSQARSMSGKHRANGSSAVFLSCSARLAKSAKAARLTNSSRRFDHCATFRNACGVRSKR